MKRRVSSKAVVRWRLTCIIGNRARDICQIEAASAEDAIKCVIGQYSIDDPHQQSKLCTYRVV